MRRGPRPRRPSSSPGRRGRPAGCWAMMRILTVVGRPASTKTPAAFADVALDPGALRRRRRRRPTTSGTAPSSARLRPTLPGAAQAGRALPDLDHGHGRLGRDARDVAPDVRSSIRSPRTRTRRPLNFRTSRSIRGRSSAELGHRSSFPIAIGIGRDPGHAGVERACARGGKPRPGRRPARRGGAANSLSRVRWITRPS